MHLQLVWLICSDQHSSCWLASTICSPLASLVSGILRGRLFGTGREAPKEPGTCQFAINSGKKTKSKSSRVEREESQSGCDSVWRTTIWYLQEWRRHAAEMFQLRGPPLKSCLYSPAVICPSFDCSTCRLPSETQLIALQNAVGTSTPLVT